MLCQPSAGKTSLITKKPDSSSNPRHRWSYLPCILKGGWLDLLKMLEPGSREKNPTNTTFCSRFPVGLEVDFGLGNIQSYLSPKCCVWFLVYILESLMTVHQGTFKVAEFHSSVQNHATGEHLACWKDLAATGRLPPSTNRLTVKPQSCADCKVAPGFCISCDITMGTQSLWYSSSCLEFFW